MLLSGELRWNPNRSKNGNVSLQKMTKFWFGSNSSENLRLLSKLFDKVHLKLYAGSNRAHLGPDIGCMVVWPQFLTDQFPTTGT